MSVILAWFSRSMDVIFSSYVLLLVIASVSAPTFDISKYSRLSVLFCMGNARTFRGKLRALQNVLRFLVVVTLDHA